MPYIYEASTSWLQSAVLVTEVRGFGRRGKKEGDQKHRVVLGRDVDDNTSGSFNRSWNIVYTYEYYGGSEKGMIISPFTGYKNNAIGKWQV